MFPEDKINQFVTRVREASGSNVESIILFGSAVSGDFHPGLSDLNLFCVLRDTSFPALRALAPVVKWWSSQKQPPPLCMSRLELDRSTDVFAIELLDMVQHHRVLLGDDVLRNLQVPMGLHRVQVEYELREKLILLRQHLLLATDKDSQLLDIILHSAPSFATLFRHALITLGGNKDLNRREAVRTLSGKLDFDPSAILQALDIREGKLDQKKSDVRSLCTAYLAAVEKVAAAVDSALDSEAPEVR